MSSDLGQYMAAQQSMRAHNNNTLHSGASAAPTGQGFGAVVGGSIDKPVPGTLGSPLGGDLSKGSFLEKMNGKAVLGGNPLDTVAAAVSHYAAKEVQGNELQNVNFAPNTNIVGVVDMANLKSPGIIGQDQGQSQGQSH